MPASVLDARDQLRVIVETLAREELLSSGEGECLTNALIGADTRCGRDGRRYIAVQAARKGAPA